MPTDPPTPQAVLDLFVLLSPEGQKEFLLSLGKIAIAEVPFLITSELSLPERERFANMVHAEIAGELFPVLVQEARRLVREHPQLSDEEFDKQLLAETSEIMERYNRAIEELERAKLKEQRDRKSDPETIRRNVEICDLRKQDPKKWSYGRLAKKYDLKKQSVKKILEEEDKWRRLTAQG